MAAEDRQFLDPFEGTEITRYISAGSVSYRQLRLY